MDLSLQGRQAPADRGAQIGVAAALQHRVEGDHLDVVEGAQVAAEGAGEGAVGPAGGDPGGQVGVEAVGRAGIPRRRHEHEGVAAEQQGQVLQHLRQGRRGGEPGQQVRQGEGSVGQESHHRHEPVAVALDLAEAQPELEGPLGRAGLLIQQPQHLQPLQGGHGVAGPEWIEAVDVHVAAEGLVGEQVAHQLPQARVALLAQQLAVGLRQHPIEVVGQGGAAEEGEAPLTRFLDHLVGVEGVPLAVVVLVQQVGGVELGQALEAGGQGRLAGEQLGVGLAQGREQLLAGPEGGQAIALAGLEAAHPVLERHGGQPAGQGVVGEVEEAPGAQGLGGQPQERGAHGGGNPAEDAVGHHDVDGPPVDAPGRGGAGLQIEEVGLEEGDVGQPRGCGQGAAVGDVVGVEVDAQEVGLGVVGGLQAQVEALAAAQLHHLEGAGEIGRAVAAQQREEGQPIRERLGVGAVDVVGSGEVAVAQGHCGRGARGEAGAIGARRAGSGAACGPDGPGGRADAWWPGPGPSPGEGRFRAPGRRRRRRPPRRG